MWTCSGAANLERRRVSPTTLDVVAIAKAARHRRQRHGRPGGRCEERATRQVVGSPCRVSLSTNRGLSYSDPYGLCPEDVTFWQAVGCVAIETGTAILGSGAGFIAGGGAGLVASAPTGGLAAPITVTAGAATGVVAGGLAGKLAGEALTNVLFSKRDGEFRGGSQTARDPAHARLMQEFRPDKAQRARIHREIAKRKKGNRDLDADELREVFEEIVGEQ